MKKIHISLMVLLFVAVLAFPIISLISIEEEPADERINCVINNHGITEDAAGKPIYSWGLVRGKNGDVPQVAEPDKELLYKYSGVYLGDTDQNKIYLTFDEGYENGFTADILDTLKEKNVKAVFFITGDYLEDSPELVGRMIEEGHEIGNHSKNHYSFAKISSKEVENEIKELDNKLLELFNKTTYFVRPPKGEFNETSLCAIESIGKKCMMWSFAYKDWIINSQNGSKYAYDTIIGNLHNGAIILLHAVSQDNALALGDVIDEARKRGFEFGEPGDFKS